LANVKPFLFYLVSTNKIWTYNRNLAKQNFFKIWNFWPTKLWKALLVASIKVRSMAFLPNLRSIKFTTPGKAPSTLIGNSLLERMILDNSSSMYYPEIKEYSLGNLNKIGFGVLSIAALMQVLKKQRDAVGLSIYSDTYDFHASEKNSERHFQMLYSKLNEVAANKTNTKETKTYTFLHQIAEKIHRRSLIFLFTDMFQTEAEEEKLFEALRHLKYNKHSVVLFHLLDHEHELNFDFDNIPKRFVDVETGEQIDLYADSIKKAYSEKVMAYRNDLKLKCGQYHIKYMGVDIRSDFSQVLNSFMVERQKFA